MKAILALADGRIFEGKSFGSTGEAGGGMANGLVGSTLLLLVASILGLPIGVLGAVYLAEFGGNRVATAIRFSADVLAGVPSIISGMVAYSLLVVPFKQFSALAGAVSLALIMIPDSGWFTSCAMDAVKTPRLVARATFASSEVALARASSESRRAVTS